MNLIGYMEFPLIETVIWTLVILLSFIIFLLVFFLKIVRNNIRLKEARNKKYTNIIEKLLVEFLYSENEEVALTNEQTRIIRYFKKGLSSKYKRKIIINVFIKLSQEISGNMIETMHKLYDEIGLLKYAYKKLKSKKWNIVALGIRDVREFRVKKAQSYIKKFINHPREEVRREAHLYFIDLFGYEGLDFLDNLKLPLSEWDQIQLLGKIDHIQNNEILEPSKWLKSKNDYVVIFVLTIVKIYNRLETKDILLENLDHQNIEVRLKAIEVLTHFNVVEAKDILKPRFNTISIKEQLAFFELLEKTAMEEDTTFIIDHISSLNFEIKHKALRILNSINKNLYDKLEKTSDDESYNEIIHFLDGSYGV
tara:strand:+ start:313 stop:1410 length:1098 start_codon:yes stop_codon:yes gene_type:complete